MRFVRVTFRCFGPFEEHTFDLSAHGAVQIIFGPNEAGKSAALRGLRAFLFGFPVQSGDDFRFKYNQFRVHAVLQDASGRTFECIRRKGYKDTLRKLDDKTPVPDGELTAFCGGLTETQFEQLFGLDASRLVEGGHTISDGKGDLGEALFAAGAGLAGLRATARKLESRAESLYLPGGKKQRIAERLRAYRELMDRARTEALPPEKYEAAVVAAKAGREAADRLISERSEVRSRHGRLERYRSVLPTIDLLQSARQRSQAIEDVPLLPPNFSVTFEQARTKRDIAASECSHVRAEIDGLAAQLSAENPAEALLAEEAELDGLKELVGADQKLREEQVKADTFRRDEEAKARDIFRNLTGSTDWERMYGFKPRLEDRQRILELANQFSAVSENLTRLEDTHRDSERQLEQLERQLANAAVIPDPSSWQAVYEAVTARGSLEDLVAARTQALEVECGQLNAEFARLRPASPVTWQKSPAHAVPLIETVARLQKELELARTSEADAADALRQNLADAEELRAQCDLIRAGEPVPTIEELHSARLDRDEGISLAGHRLSGNADEPAEIGFLGRHAPFRSLIDAVKAAVDETDRLADRLRIDAARVAKWDVLQHRLHSVQQARPSLEAEAAQRRNDTREVERRWAALWVDSGISPEAPEDMMVWLTKWNKLCERTAGWLKEKQELNGRISEIGSLRAALAGVYPAAHDSPTLAAALIQVKNAIAHVGEEISAEQKLVESLERQRLLSKTASDDVARARDRQNDWFRRWTAATAVLQLQDACPSVQIVHDYLNRIDEMQKHLTDMRIKAARVREIADGRDVLVKRLTALRQRLDRCPRPTSAETLDADFRALETDLRHAREQRTRAVQISQQLDLLRSEFEKADDRRREAEAILGTLAVQARVADPDGIPEAVQRASERADVEARLRQYEEAVIKNAQGEAIDSFIAAAINERDGLDEQIERLRTRMTQLDADVSSAEETARDAARVVSDFQRASDAAADARQGVALLSRQLEDDIIDYASLHLSLAAISRAKERYRARHQDTMIDRAGGFFRLLTDGAFSRIDIENDEGTDVLKVVRADESRPDGRVRVDGLSDGTRDQLFLALRLAGIERHLESREPVPLIVDDVLVNFDDGRTRSTLACLAELAKKTQIIIFTHHRHVVELAQAVDRNTAIHDLSPCSTALQPSRSTADRSVSMDAQERPPRSSNAALAKREGVGHIDPVVAVSTADEHVPG